MTPEVKAFFDPDTFTISYLVSLSGSRECAVIDPVLDFDPASGRTAERSISAIIHELQQRDLELAWILETHAHADHLSGAQVLQRECGGRIGIGQHIVAVQQNFAGLFDMGEAFPADGSQFDRLFADEETFALGAAEVRVLHTPGHTPACVSYLIGDACFVGDTLFMPDYGTARADFPGGDAATLYRSIRRILALPPQTRLFMCHDYQPGGRDLRWETTVADEREHNILIADGVDEAEFVATREQRDARLAAPRLILPSLQVNIAAGHLPAAAGNGIAYLKIPLNQLGRG